MAKQQTFEIVFEPLISGAYSGTVVITSDSITSPDIILVTGLGVSAYIPSDITVSHSFKRSSNSVYKGGSILLGPSVQAIITESLVRVLDAPEFEGLTFDPTKVIPAPLSSMYLRLREVDTEGNDGSEYTLILPDTEPKYFSSASTSADYYEDTVANDTTYLYLNDKNITELVASEEQAIYLLNSLVHSSFTFSDTGTIWKYGYVTLINYLLDNLEKFSKICTMVGVDYSDLAYYKTYTPKRSWREKSLKELKALMTEATVHRLKTTYSINYEYTSLEIVLYYFMDLYKRILDV